MKHRCHVLLEDAAAHRSDELGLIDFDGPRYTWRDVNDAALDAERCLKSNGVRPGDRVVLVFENCAEAIVFFYACSRCDAMAVMVNARLSQVELERILDHSDPSVVVFASRASDAAQARAEQFGASEVTDGFGTVCVLKRPNSSSEPSFEDGREQVALLLYTSGTTGLPKAAMLTHANLLAAAETTTAMRHLTSSDVMYLALPLSHIFGLVAMLAITCSKSSVRMEKQFSAERLYQALKTDVTVLPAVPQMHAHLFNYARAQGVQKYDGTTLRHVSSGGAPLDPAWKREAEAFYGLPLQNGYGLTELAAGVCATSHELGDPDISVGYPLGDCALKLDMDAPGATPEEGIGEILISGPQVLKGYFRDPQQTEAAITKDGFFRSGDLGRLDEEGRLHIAGRTKELIIRSGFNVYPVEIEATLTEHPDIVVAAVVGRSAQGNEEVLAFVTLSDDSDMTEEALKAWVHDKLAPYKRPSRIVIADQLPTAATGKILKAKLIETFAAELAEG